MLAKLEDHKTEQNALYCNESSAGYPACKILRRFFGWYSPEGYSTLTRPYIGRHIIIGQEARGREQFVYAVVRDATADMLTLNVRDLCNTDASNVAEQITKVFDEASRVLRDEHRSTVIVLSNIDAITNASEHATRNTFIVQETLEKFLGSPVTETGLHPQIEVLATVENIENIHTNLRSALAHDAYFIEIPTMLNVAQFKSALVFNGYSNMSDNDCYEAFMLARGLTQQEIENVARNASGENLTIEQFKAALSQAQSRQSPFNACIAKIFSVEPTDVITAGACIWLGYEVYTYFKKQKAEKHA